MMFSFKLEFSVLFTHQKCVALLAVIVLSVYDYMQYDQFIALRMLLVTKHKSWCILENRITQEICVSRVLWSAQLLVVWETVFIIIVADFAITLL